MKKLMKPLRLTLIAGVMALSATNIANALPFWSIESFEKAQITAEQAIAVVKTLVDNAIRYTPKGSQIDLSVQQREQDVLIQVEDNGMGIAPEDRERVLDPFYRILGTEQQGSGLGLTIASEIVKNYHGTIALKDSRHFDQGLLVEVRLPRV